MKQNCTGNGRCLSVDYGNDMYYYFSRYDCKYKCKAVECINYKLCGESFREQDKKKCKYCIKAWKGNDPVLILNNTITFIQELNNILYEKFGQDICGEIMKFIKNIKCQLCPKDQDYVVEMPNCGHYICIDCFEHKYTNNWNGTKRTEEDEEFYHYHGQYGICAICDRDEDNDNTDEDSDNDNDSDNDSDY
jgi:hypothetical protein